jgi:tetraacyldisaccharide 4'-kinase
MDLHKLSQTHLLRRSLLSYTLWPVGLLYALLQKKRRQFWKNKAWQAPCKVISIGNIVSGGSGKTPLTIALARLLDEKGLNVAISHRGYKGAFENNARLISDRQGLLYSADQTGDEAYLIAASLPSIPVVAGRKRQQAIKLLLSHYPATQVIILDDALQHVRVKRDLDIVSFASETGIGNGFVLPAGYLREPLSSLSQDCLIIIYHSNPKKSESIWQNDLKNRNHTLLSSHAKPRGCCDALGNHYPLDSLQGKRLVLVSGIAAPKTFESTVRSLGLSFIKHYAFPDHYDFQDPKLETGLCHEMPEYLLCTQKDLMKLAIYPKLASKLRALVLDYVFDDPEQLWGLIAERILA